MNQDYARTHLVDELDVGRDDRVIGRGPARHALRGEVVVAFGGELAAGLQLHLRGIAVVRAGTGADTEAVERILLGQEHRLALENIGIHRPPGAPALDRVRVIYGPALLDEIVEPALAPVGRGLVSDPAQAAAVPHQERQRAALVLRDEILHIHLLDLIDAVGIDLRGHAARREYDLLDGLARDRVLAPAHVERAHFLQRNRRLRAARERRRDHHPSYVLHLFSPL